VLQVKSVLDQQVAVRSELKAKQKLERENFDKRILEQARREIDQENE